MNAPLSPSHELLKRAASSTRAHPVRVMIVDDSLTVRTIFKRMVESDQSLTVVATASSAERALSELRAHNKASEVDVILLDLEMPGMGGLEALPAILQTAEQAQVLVVSSLTEDGAEATLSALSMGAADTMPKPRPGGFNEDYRSQLLGKIRALGSAELDDASASDEARAQPPAAPLRKVTSPRPEVVAIGASTGGIHALNLLLRALPTDFTLPILITQHLPASFIPVFARQVEMACDRRTQIAEDGTVIGRGEIGIATGHGHMLVRRESKRLICRVSAEPARSGCLPSVDPMLASAAEAFEGRVLAVILSGMGRDGIEGASKVVDQGGTVMAQDAASSAVWGMPGAVTNAGLTSLVAPPEQLAEAILAHSLAVASR